MNSNEWNRNELVNIIKVYIIEYKYVDLFYV